MKHTNFLVDNLLKTEIIYTNIRKQVLQLKFSVLILMIVFHAHAQSVFVCIIPVNMML